MFLKLLSCLQDQLEAHKYHDFKRLAAVTGLGSFRRTSSLSGFKRVDSSGSSCASKKAGAAAAAAAAIREYAAAAVGGVFDFTASCPRLEDVFLLQHLKMTQSCMQVMIIPWHLSNVQSIKVSSVILLDLLYTFRWTFVHVTNDANFSLLDDTFVVMKGF